MTLWDSEVIFGLTFTELANIVLGIIIVAGIIYSIFFQKKEAEII
jgi:hypothetical protein